MSEPSYGISDTHTVCAASALTDPAPRRLARIETGGLTMGIEGFRERAGREELSDVGEHNGRETPRFAESIARQSLAKAGATPSDES
jgi:hypothetical protein